MTVNYLLREAKQEIGSVNANLLMQYVLGTDRKNLIFSLNTSVNKEQEKRFKKLLNKAKKGYPIQYLTNKVHFMGYEFFVNENVLIPQPDTEVLVEESIKKIKEKKNPKVLDLCTGSGNIAISIAKSVENVEIYASDISKKALKVAKKNANNLLKSEDDTKQIKFLKSNMFKNINEKFDVIVTNPPYIKKNEIKELEKEVKKEPKRALNGGKDGLKFYKIIKENVEEYLNDDGVLLMEIGYNQKKDIEKIFENVECIKDFANNDRVIIWKKEGKR